MNQERFTKICPVCQSRLAKKLAPWLLYCSGCGIWISLLGYDQDKTEQNNPILEEKREIGLKSLRIQNFQKILDALAVYMPLNEATVCDIGCAYGWFLEAATSRGMKAIGIEPDRAVALKGIQQGLSIKIGYFPDCINDSEQFDVITFNDSLEHLSNLDRIFEACYKLLSPGGKLVINIPNSQGIFFKIGYCLFQLGYKEPWHRLWQKEYPFPHLIYFNPSNLERYVTRYGFELLHSHSLKTLNISGLWQRLRMDRNSSILTSVLIYSLILVAYPFLVLLPSDILVQIYQKSN